MISLSSGMNIVELGCRCGTLWFFNLPSAKNFIFSLKFDLNWPIFPNDSESLPKVEKTQKFWVNSEILSRLKSLLWTSGDSSFCLHSGTLLDQRFKGYNLKIHLAGDWCAINAMQCNQHIRCFFLECLNMDNGSSSCVKVLYSACDSVSAFNEVVSSNWDRSPQMVPT